MIDPNDIVPARANWLGYAGLLPQFFAVIYAFGGPQNLWISQAAAFGYAALIFSFLGGAWWGLGIFTRTAPSWVFAVAVLPSLIAFGSYLPWIWGAEWPKPSLFILGLGLLLSPLVDRALAPHIQMPTGWLKLRFHLSVGLGLMTLAICLF